MSAKRWLSIIGLAALAYAPDAPASNYPYWKWKSIETEHFRVNYYSTEEANAQRLIVLAESIYKRLVPVIGWPPNEKVELSITDATDGANAVASAIPYDSIRFNATAPDDLSPLNDVDDWYLELVTHEFTHVLHTDHIVGLPAVVNAILGKTIAPNQIQPRFLLEGLAVFEESTKTTAGRLRSALWNMWMRADMLEGNEATLDMISGAVRRWPQGNLWYLYGSFFMQWFAETYGEQAIRVMVDDYGRQLIPYGINRAVMHATGGQGVGKTWEELYPSFVDSMKREFAAQADAVRARGIREGTRLTTTGQVSAQPRFIPKQAWDGCNGDLLYFRDDAHTTAGLYHLPLAHDASGVITGPAGKPELFVRTNLGSSPSFLPDGTLFFENVDFVHNLYGFGDLFTLKAKEKSTLGFELDGTRKRLTEGFRAYQPNVAPDGRKVAFVSNHRGTSALFLASLDPEQQVSDVRPLTTNTMFDQAYSPRFSPDGRKVAFSAWHKGLRDIRVIDIEDGTVIDVTSDRAIDGGPSFSPDGKWVYFHSDRTGIYNVYAYELETKKLVQVTNVVNGALQPQVSADGKSLVYLGYTHEGYDLFSMRLDPAAFLEPLPYDDPRPPFVPDPGAVAMTHTSYNPLHTLAPRKYSIDTSPSNFGQQFGVSIEGSDIANWHAFRAALKIEYEEPTPQFDFAYTYGRLPFDWSTRFYRSIAPGQSFDVGEGGYKQPYVQEAIGAETSLGFGLPKPFDAQSFSVAYSVARVGANTTVTPSKLDPYETPAYPATPFAALLRMGWAYNSTQRFGWSVSAEKGFALSATFDFTHPYIASDYSGYRINLNGTTYVLMPWLRHHVLALHLGSGTSGGSFPGTPFYVGGWVDVSPLDSVTSFIVQGGFVMRGYPTAFSAGRYYALANAEYRFPIVNIDRGLSTLPVMLNRINGSVFMDYGGAFNTWDWKAAEALKVGIGAELWFDLTLGYYASFTFRAGYARGLATGGIDKVYFVAVIPF